MSLWSESEKSLTGEDRKGERPGRKGEKTLYAPTMGGTGSGPHTVAQGAGQASRPVAHVVAEAALQPLPAKGGHFPPTPQQALIICTYRL